MSLIVLIPGFGTPHWKEKVDILEKNINVIEKHFAKYDVHIVQYTYEHRLPDHIIQNEHVHIVHDKGILGRNMHVHFQPNLVTGYDYVLILLDDVELGPDFDWDHLIYLKKELHVDIISPSLPSPSMTVWNFMLQAQNPKLIASILTRCELFCYLMIPSIYEKYYTYIDPNNPWMWGMDFMLYSHMGFRVGLAHRVTMKHHFWRSQDTHDPAHCPRIDSDAYLQKYNTNWRELHMLPSELERATIIQ